MTEIKHMKLNRIPWVTLLATAPALTFSAVAQSSPDTIEALKQQIQELDQKVRVLERKRELDQDTSAEKAKTTPVISAGANGFSLRSADTNFVLKIRGYIQADARFYPNDNKSGTSNDTFLMRRVRPIIEGTVYDKYDYRVMMDFGTGITSSTGNNGFLQDAYVNARFLPEFQLQAGKFKEPVGLERLQSGANLLFVERAYPTQLVPNRDVGVQLQGDISDGVLSYAAGVFNGVNDGGSDDIETADDEKDVAARLFAHPFKKTSIEPLQKFGIGIAGTYGNQEGALRTFVSPGQQCIFGYRSGAGTAAAPNVAADGDHWRLVPQFYYYWKSLGVYGEYAISEQKLSRTAGAAPVFGTINNQAWSVSTSYILTGEENSFKPLVPKHPFSFNGGGWGAWEVAAQLSQLKVDDAAFPLFADRATSASKATSWGVGLNWYLNKNVKLNLDYEQTDFADGDKTPLTAKGEQAVLGRVQLSF